MFSQQRRMQKYFFILDLLSISFVNFLLISTILLHLTPAPVWKKQLDVFGRKSARNPMRHRNAVERHAYLSGAQRGLGLWSWFHCRCTFVLPRCGHKAFRM